MGQWMSVSEYPSKWCTCSAVWLLLVWYHVRCHCKVMGRPLNCCLGGGGGELRSYGGGSTELRSYGGGHHWTYVLSPFLTGRMFVRPNILRTLWRTMIHFLIELLVRRIWFGQSKLYFILSWLVMRCKLQPELVADAQQTAWSKM